MALYIQNAWLGATPCTQTCYEDDPCECSACPPACGCSRAWATEDIGDEDFYLAHNNAGFPEFDSLADACEWLFPFSGSAWYIKCWTGTKTFFEKYIIGDEGADYSTSITGIHLDFLSTECFDGVDTHEWASHSLSLRAVSPSDTMDLDYTGTGTCDDYLDVPVGITTSYTGIEYDIPGDCP